MFGRKEDQEGNPIHGDNSFAMPQTGFVDDCKITYIGPDVDQQTGEKIKDRGLIVYQQPNGAEVYERIFQPSESDNPNVPDVQTQADQLTRRMKHICTKLNGVDDETFHSKTQVDNFQDFMKAVKSLIDNNLGENDKFRIAFCYNKKGYLGTRMFPNFIERMDIPYDQTTLGWNDKYDFLENPTKQASEDPVTTGTEGEEELDW